LEEEVKEKDDENRQLQQSVRSLAEQVGWMVLRRCVE